MVQLFDFITLQLQSHGLLYAEKRPARLCFLTAHENTAGHTSSAANGPFIAYMLGLVLLAGCMLKMLVGKYVHR